MIRHQQFIEALSKIPGEAPEWNAVASGYLVLRAFDDWTVLGPVGIVNDCTTVGILEKIHALPDEHRAEREVLVQIMSALCNSADTSLRSVSAPILAYGGVLENNGQWILASAVYTNIAEMLEARTPLDREECSVASFAYRREAFSLRNAQDYAGAEIAYRRAIVLGEKAKDDQAHLQAKLGLAITARVRGNLPAAEEALNALLSECSTYDAKTIETVRPGLLHARGALRHDRGQYTDALLDFFDAYQSSQDPDSKEMILANIGASAEEAGFPELARNALNIVVLTSRRHMARQLAIVNLIENAIVDDNEVAFTRLRNMWQPEYCDAHLNAYARLYVARGLERFSTREHAIEAFRDAASYAEKAEIHKAQFEALHDLERLERDISEDTHKMSRASHPLPEVLQPLTQALSEIYILAATHHEQSADFEKIPS